MRHTPHSAYPMRPRVPLGLIVAGAIVLLVPISVVLAWLWLQWSTLEASAPRVAAGLRYTIFIAPIAVALSYAGMALLGAYNRWAGRPAAYADKTVALELARRSQGLPAQIQSLSYSDSHKDMPMLPAPEMDITAQIAPPSDVPSFAQLLDQGLIGPGRPLILGYDAATGQAITGGWKDLYSCGVGAQQGAGKTWLLAFLLAQSVAAGGKLIICDLHAGDDESLANRIAGLANAFMCDIASTPKEIVAALKLADDKLEARKSNNARWPIVICCDEWTSLLRTAAGAELPKYIQNIAEQGRKFNVNGLLAAQAWTKEASSGVRNQLTSHYVLRQRPDEARYQLGLRSDHLPDDVRSLPDACGYFLNVKGDLVKVIIPRMTPADIARCGELIDWPASAAGQPFGFQLATQPLTPMVATRSPDGSQMVAKPNQATTPTQRLKTASPEAVRAADMFKANRSPAEIVLELKGVKSNQGRTYQTALDEVLNLIREGVQS